MPDELDPLSQIIADLNERYGLNLGPEHRVTLDRIMTRLDDDAALDASARVNTRENVRFTFDQRVEDVFQEIIDSDFDFYQSLHRRRKSGRAVAERTSSTSSCAAIARPRS